MVRVLGEARREWFAACTASSLMGVQAAVEGGLGVTVLGRSFVQDGMQVLQSPEHWPPLPMTEIVLLGEETRAIRPRAASSLYLTENLSMSKAQSDYATLLRWH